jgi:type III secretion protein J
MPRTENPPRPRRRAHRALPLLLALAAAGCGREEVLHGLDQGQANEVVVALDEGGVRGEQRRMDGSEERWTVVVPSSEAPQARRILAERELPRTRPPGFAEVFGKGSMVPTPTEERALYLHALSGELSRSVEAIDGVLAARVHLAVAPHDPLRPGPSSPARAAVLVKARPGARGRLEPLTPGIQALVAGAVSGLDPQSVSVVVADGSALAPRPAPRRSALVPLVLAIVLALAAAAVLVAPALRGRLRFRGQSR